MLGKTYWKVLKFVVNKISRDVYVILPIPYAGLHWSIHFPKPPTFPNWLMHVRSRKELGIEEKVELDLSQMLDSIKSFIGGFLDTWRIGPLTKEETLVMPPNLFSCFLKRQTQHKEKTTADLGQFITAISRGTFYRTRAKHLPHLLHKIKRENPSLDVNIFGVSNDRMVIPITSNRMLEFDYRQLTERLGDIPLADAFFDPMQRAIERFREIKPDAFQQWLPNNLGRDIDNLVEPLKSSKPRFVDFPSKS